MDAHHPPARLVGAPGRVTVRERSRDTSRERHDAVRAAGGVAPLDTILPEPTLP
ncbi:hypothetical protein [Plantactinospora sp. GCM10030261]|uniref:hypothetical protein n=1 Tax=Plantactinospora sp. GCM10030261 TaxID=3273420 RepID=UPI003605BB6F